MYLTPSRYRASGFGVDVSTMEDAELRAVLVRASSLVDVYCGIPMQPSRHDFRGGSITGEQHAWRLATDVGRGTRRVYPMHRPLNTATSFVVKFTNTFQVSIDPANIYVNRIEGWMEVVSLAAVASGLYPVGVNFGLYTPVAEIGYTYGYSFSVEDEEMIVTDGNTYQAIRGSWSASPAPIIKKNGSVITTGFTTSISEGEVVFDAPNAASDIITATYTYTLPDAVVDATGVVATHLLGERSLASKGMSGLSSIKVAEVALARTRNNAAVGEMGNVIPETAMNLLYPYVYRNVA